MKLVAKVNLVIRTLPLEQSSFKCHPKLIRYTREIRPNFESKTESPPISPRALSYIIRNCLFPLDLSHCENEARKRNKISNCTSLRNCQLL